MKGLLSATTVLVVLVGLAWAGRLWSEDKPAPPTLHTRIGLFNLTYVISYYDKYKAFKESMKAQAKDYEDRLKALQTQLESLAKELKDAPADKRDELEKKRISAEVLAETLKKEGQTILAKKMDEEMVVMYKEVGAAAERYAKAHDLELVLQYNEPLDPAEFHSAQNVGRKMNAGACLPVYHAPGLEISQELLAMLQADLKKDK